jgi:hypothetical protein
VVYYLQGKHKRQGRSLADGGKMYRRKMPEQQTLDIPFDVKLATSNRWVILASIIPWGKIEEEYAKNFKAKDGQVSKSSRLAFGALYIQKRLAITDEEVVLQIQETPSMQYFCGYASYIPEKPFDSSLMVHFRKRITAEMLKTISEEALAEEAKKAIEKEKGDDDTDDGNDPPSNPEESTKDSTPDPKGIMLLDATCCPSDIHYPTDLGLLNHARELTEKTIDALHAPLIGSGTIKPRTYRKKARKDYMSYVKKRRHTPEEVRLAISYQLRYVRRNITTIEKQLAEGASLSTVDKGLAKKLPTIKEAYRQQQQMYDERTHSIENRIVSIAQPYLRPIVRGKANAPVEFGAKVATAHIGGFTFLIHMDYENFSEGTLLEKSAMEYKRIFGFYPKVIIGDKAYTTNGNRRFCKANKIRLSAQKRGRMSEAAKEEQRKQLYEDNCKRNAVEGDYGTTKRKYGLGLIMTKLYETTLTAISFGFFVKNMERVLRLLVLPLLLGIGIIWNFLLRRIARVIQ